MMRTTTTSVYRSMQLNIARAEDELNRLYMHTEKRVNVASDDPSAVRAIENARSQMTMSDRYIENIETVQDGMDIVDGYLDTVENIMQRIQEITTAAINSSLSDADAVTYADEVATLKEQLVDVANTQVNGKYLFAGFTDDTQPFSVDAVSGDVSYDGTTDIKYVEVGPGETVQSNLTGDVLFTDPVDVFAVFDDLEANLRAGDVAALQVSLDAIEPATDQIRTQRSLMGNDNARLEDNRAMLEEVKLQMKTTLSRYEDADMIEVFSDMTQAETALEAALAVSSRLNSLSLLDYM
ncbi:flagellar hook-associated protein FlgL [Desulfuromonas acetoxidans]|uniref:Flagellin-like n=1 Tax=Desulfuromonas acetoxidans (strain DSM 684 / 11070) TaxID=281689 RepID=Q1K373_DESA6|nr:flagellar hook-associated protein FlgL [Desulfuromonas acetoxidans]EAT17101.1 flagellin-like [Desulfuromonas acetoxidans DSM 684]MBF0645675.1 flagellar hook-associated protein FlgL [Desulfuromonas acetoxidans]NVD24108.1 flagellar hook-associated protein FlgL [Desulfuromonas acetoxidans]NVE16404.1 flagellar hook-associated protein FlgL [Desulfuromonas acetoxidans]